MFIASWFCRLVNISLTLCLKDYALACLSNELSILACFFSSFDSFFLSFASFRSISILMAIWSLCDPSPHLLALVTNQKCLLEIKIWPNCYLFLCYWMDPSIIFPFVVKESCCRFEVVELYDVSDHVSLFISKFVSMRANYSV